MKNRIFSVMITAIIFMATMYLGFLMTKNSVGTAVSYCDKTYGADQWEWHIVKCNLACEYQCLPKNYTG